MIRPRSFLRMAFAALGAAACLPGSLLAQCALCGESVANASKTGGADPALGFSWGVLVLLGFVGCLASGLAGFIAYAARGATRDAARGPGSAG